MAALDLCLFDVDGRLRERCCSFFDTRLDVGFPIEVRNGRSGSGSIKMEGLRRAAQFFEREPAGCHQCEQGLFVVGISARELVIFCDSAVKVLLAFQNSAKLKPN